MKRRLYLEFIQHNICLPGPHHLVPGYMKRSPPWMSLLNNLPSAQTFSRAYIKNNIKTMKEKKRKREMSFGSD